MQEGKDAASLQVATNTTSIPFRGAEAFRHLELLLERLEDTGWSPSTRAEDGIHLGSLLLDAANVVLHNADKPEATALSDLPAVLGPLHGEAAAFARVVALIEAYSSASSEEASEQRRRLDKEFQSLLRRLQVQTLRSSPRGKAALQDWRFWLPWLGLTLLCTLLGLGWWGFTAPVSPAPVVLADFIAKTEAVKTVVRARQGDQSRVLDLAPASGGASRRMVQTDFSPQLRNLSDEQGRMLTWRGPSGAPLDFGPEFGRAEIVTIGETGEVFLSFSGVAPSIWKAVDIALDHAPADNDLERMSQGDVLYIPWNKWMGVRLLRHGQHS